MFNLAEALKACVGGATWSSPDPEREPLGATAALPGFILVRQTKANQRCIADVIDAMGDVWRDDFAVSEPVSLPEGTLRVYNIAPLLTATGDPDDPPWTVDPSLNVVRVAVRDAITLPPERFRRIVAHGRVLIVIGDEEVQRLARAHVARLRDAGAPVAGQESP